MQTDYDPLDPTDAELAAGDFIGRKLRRFWRQQHGREEAMRLEREALARYHQDAPPSRPRTSSRPPVNMMGRTIRQQELFA